MNVLCCMSLTFAARIIAAFGLSLAILILNIVISEYFGRTKDEFFHAVEPWSLLGLNWTRFVHKSNIPNRVLVIFSCFSSYLVLYLITSFVLAIGTVLRKPSMAAPWLYFQISSIADQMIALLIHLTSVPEPDTAGRSHWYIPICTFYLTFTIYFWMVVFAACEEWTLNPIRSLNDSDIFDTIVDEPTQVISESHPEKSPSFLAQNNIFFEILTPPSPPLPSIPEKYDIV